MPVYDYLCPECGPITALRPMAAYDLPWDCACGATAPRAFLAAPALSGLDPGRRAAFATNERSSNEPKRSGSHPAACGCCAPRQKSLTAEAVPAKSFPSQRPWMISH